MTNREASLQHDATDPLTERQQPLQTGPTTPKLPPLAPGELAHQLRLIPPIVPVADGYGQHKPRPFFAACAYTQCGGPTEKLVFMAYASLSGPNGATWAVKRGRAYFFARQAKVAAIAECTVRTVHKMTLRLLTAGRLRRVMSGRGTIPHAFQVVPGGWNSQAGSERGAGLNLVDRNVVPVNRAFTTPPDFLEKEGGGGCTRYEPTPPAVIRTPKSGKPASPLEAVASPPSQSTAQKKDLRPGISIVERHADPVVVESLLSDTAAQLGLRRGVTTPKLRPTSSQPPLPESTPERRAAALATIEAFDATMDLGRELSNLQKKVGGPSLQPSPDNGWVYLEGYTGGTPDTCPTCGHDRIYAGGCENCGADLRDFGDDWNHGH